jgi:RHS repeat-associated protein
MGPDDVRGDIDLNGVVDEDDSSTISSDYSGIVMGREVLSDEDVWSARGYTGASCDICDNSAYDIRNRQLSSRLGRWLSRDRASLFDMFLYEYLYDAPLSYLDPEGLQPHPLSRLSNLRNKIQSIINFFQPSCLDAPPVPPSESACSEYGSSTWGGVSQKCVCLCSGNNGWANKIRGCLLCMHDQGVGPTEAHAKCIPNAGPPTPSQNLAFSACVCKCIVFEIAGAYGKGRPACQPPFIGKW